jgi:glycosyltransferase involved in cell wall biosynthesis
VGSAPLISVVTPFYNTQMYLAECIESVLGQTHQNWEYILVDNCSTDGSSEIAQRYASRFPGKIRLIRPESFLTQVQNYNFALSCISPGSKYCKVVQADDWIFPECLQLMAKAFEQSDSVGLVSSYWLKGTTLRGSGFPYPAPLLPGRDMGRLYIRTGLFVFGSPTAVMYRSSLVRNCQPFYDESLLHEDTEKCIQILEHWDFGFVHQVLSFSRADNESISTISRPFQPDVLDWYINVQRYADVFLEPGEAASLRKQAKQAYYGVLAQEAFRFREAAFWRYHEEGLKTLSEALDWHRLALEVGRRFVAPAVGPVNKLTRALRSRNSRMSGKKASTA